ncbi:hypothetical protein F7C95_18530 [Opitutia bacterium ISCC 51]|nr:hypothetical protein F7C95_18530 [Opitutae bacterium ISCC 51]QXD27960.1 hypothetical protein GA003_18435 [Opitutae bacterium ISCC 52]
MKKAAAVLIIMAILNPLCCCFAFGEGHQVDMPMKADHSCCTSESQAPGSANQEQDAMNCEQARDSVITANAHISIPFASLLVQSDFFKEAQSLDILQTSLEAPPRNYEATQSVPRWVGIQTDCVRRL